MSERNGSEARWENLHWLINGNGHLTIGRVGPIECAATAADAHDALAMLVRRPGEAFEALLTRLDEAVRLATEEDIFTDEING
jgi:hypothetical protein